VVITSFDLKLNGIDIIIIDDLKKNYIPVFHIYFTLLLSKTDQNTNDSSIKASLGSEIYFFNPLVAKLEPFMESNTIMFFYKKLTNTVDINIELDPQTEAVNLNISDRMIKQIERFYSHWFSELDRIEGLFRRK